MTTVTVSPATAGDVDALVASVIALFREDAGTHDPAMDVDWPLREGSPYYAGLVGDPACLLALARDGDRVVGHLVGKLLEPEGIRLERFAVLESMRVDPGARRAGVGGALIGYFLAWARERGVRQASVTAFAANEAAQRLYVRHGFAPHAVTLRSPL
jgi:GNAT superfamily N-acetyltransferase